MKEFHMMMGFLSLGLLHMAMWRALGSPPPLNMGVFSWFLIHSWRWLRATSHTRLRARDHYTSSTLIGGKGSAGPSSLHTTFRGTNGVCEWQDGCKVYMDSYMAPNGSCFMVTWTIFKNHLMEVGLVQNRETMALWTLTTVGLFHFIMCEDPHE
jgi:hypothetical protein